LYHFNREEILHATIKNLSHHPIYVRTLPCGASCTSLLWTTPSTSGGVVCRPVSTLKADIMNITY